MAGYCTLVLHFQSPAACENTDTHSCNIQPYCLLSHQIIYIYIYLHRKPRIVFENLNFVSIGKVRTIQVVHMCKLYYLGFNSDNGLEIGKWTSFGGKWISSNTSV